MAQEQQVVYYTLVEAPQESEGERLMRHARSHLICGRTMLCMSIICLVVAGCAPLWAVASLKGEGQVFMVEYSVDFDVGSGFWQKNVCFGGSWPSDETLAKFGLSCAGTSALDGCEFDENGRDINGNEECNLLQAAEVLSVFSITCGMVGLFVATCAGPTSIFRLTFATVFSTLASIAGCSVGTIMDQTHMMDRNYGCSDVLGADLCFRTGPSKSLQTIGFCFAFMSSIMILLGAYKGRQAYLVSEFSAFGTHRSTVPSGVVVV